MTAVTQPLPYKFVVFKNSHPFDWDRAEIYAFDQKSDPTLTKDMTLPVHFLSEFCVAALGSITEYLRRLNQSIKETPKGYAWNITSIRIERDESGTLSSREFAIIVELVNSGAEFLKVHPGGTVLDQIFTEDEDDDEDYEDGSIVDYRSSPSTCN
ncbi:hypothetical protein H072_4786 [Dactylellina haptotyla CBS 200.50]|uniref:Uncharacterized protein n=1 Tax=Dactylellina haptotyla (strain CBS 200.50) TaxID=1284197 RepID=S8AJP1_DACHA|nr:hypothetical protein H072_4786 [Dactylellina haptotyla CBS 200.50]